MTSSVTVEYHCRKCKRKTNPPAPGMWYVSCACGYITAASAAQRVIQVPVAPEASKDRVPLSPHAVAYVRKADLDEVRISSHIVSGLSGQRCWADEDPFDWLAPVYDQDYVSGLEEQIKNLQDRVIMVESYEDEVLRLLREAEAERDHFKAQLVSAGLKPDLPLKTERENG